MTFLKRILLITLFIGIGHHNIIACDNDEDLNSFVFFCFKHDSKSNCENALTILDVLIKQKESEYLSWYSLNKCRKLHSKIEIKIKKIDAIVPFKTYSDGGPVGW